MHFFKRHASLVQTERRLSNLHVSITAAGLMDKRGGKEGRRMEEDRGEEYA